MLVLGAQGITHFLLPFPILPAQENQGHRKFGEKPGPRQADEAERTPGFSVTLT